MSSALLAALLLLTFVTGLVDAASVLGLGHVFAANMTGNVVFLGFALAGERLVAVPTSLCALASFAAGALGAGRLLQHRSSRALRPAFAIELALLALATALAAMKASEVALIALLGGAMGLRNAVIRKLAVPDMTTTVLTLTLTGLAADSSLAGGTNPRWRRRAAAALTMLVGAFLGGSLLKHGLWVVLAASAVVESMGVAMLVRFAPPVAPEASRPPGGTEGR
jgi:uncharacterized membrane protein YoaK (UPF0700 family)